MNTIDNYNFSGKKAIVRVDFNVPLNEKFQITDDTRIRAAIPTIKKITDTGGIAILMSHLGRPKNAFSEKYSLMHLANHLSNLLGKEILFAEDCIGEKAALAVSKAKLGDVVLLENLRFHEEEEKGDEKFAAELAKLGTVYVNDAFGTAHRAHASTAVIAKFFPENKLFGYVMEAEIKGIDKVLKHPEHPVTAILGGAKISDKIKIITRLMDKVDNLIIGGGMAFTFVKANGGKIGKSLVEDDKLELAREIEKMAKEKNVKLFIPTDAIIADQFSNEANTSTSLVNDIKEGWMGLDIGPETQKCFVEVVKNSDTILWNGPMGVFEMPKFENGTRSIAEAVAEVTRKKGTYSLVGGGDSVAAINKYNLASKVSYVSTGGGAMLEYLEGKELPGIMAILN
jgi:phosphoglycerate kinase